MKFLLFFLSVVLSATSLFALNNTDQDPYSNKSCDFGYIALLSPGDNKTITVSNGDEFVTIAKERLEFTLETNSAPAIASFYNRTSLQANRNSSGTYFAFTARAIGQTKLTFIFDQDGYPTGQPATLTIDVQ